MQQDDVEQAVVDQRPGAVASGLQVADAATTIVRARCGVTRHCLIESLTRTAGYISDFSAEST